MGSLHHSTFVPARRIAATIGGKTAAAFPAPKRQMNVSRPGSLAGFSTWASATASSGETPGPILTPMGLAMPRKYSMCAPSSLRVRSPIHG
jgi:hypothetical protein